MAFRVEIAPRAFDDLDRIAEYIKERGSFEQSLKWFNSVMDAIASLAEMPARRAVAEESEDLGQEVRLLFHGRRSRRYKVYYSIHDSTQTIQVFHVRHWARRTLSADELQELMGYDQTEET